MERGLCMCRESKWVGNTLQVKKEVGGVEYYGVVVGGGDNHTSGNAQDDLLL